MSAKGWDLVKGSDGDTARGARDGWTLPAWGTLMACHWGNLARLGDTARVIRAEGCCHTRECRWSRVVGTLLDQGTLMADQGWKDTASRGQGTLPDLGTGEHCQAGGCCQGPEMGGCCQTGGQCQGLMEEVGHCEMGTVPVGHGWGTLPNWGTLPAWGTASRTGMRGHSHLWGHWQWVRTGMSLAHWGTLSGSNDWGVPARLGTMPGGQRWRIHPDRETLLQH